MSNGAKLWCFLLFIPFLAIVGHDFYANYGTDPQIKTRLEQFDIDPSAYQSSDLGYLIVTYVPEFYDNAKALMPQEQWEQWIDPVLRLYSFVAALIPPALFFIWLLISRIFDVWPFAGNRLAKAKLPTGPAKNTYEKREAGKQFKFNRR